MIKTIEVTQTTDGQLVALIRALAKQNGEPCVLRENGEPLAVLISQEEFEHYREEQQQKAAAELRNFLEEQRTKIKHDYTEEEVEQDVLEAIHEIRAQRRNPC